MNPLIKLILSIADPIATSVMIRKITRLESENDNARATVKELRHKLKIADDRADVLLARLNASKREVAMLREQRVLKEIDKNPY